MQALLEDLDAVLVSEPERASDPGLLVSPDSYRPASEHGRAALEMLARRFGKFAEVPQTTNA
jgi:hypothetical protein